MASQVAIVELPLEVRTMAQLFANLTTDFFSFSPSISQKMNTEVLAFVPVCVSTRGEHEEQVAAAAAAAAGEAKKRGGK